MDRLRPDRRNRVVTAGPTGPEYFDRPVLLFHSLSLHFDHFLAAATTGIQAPALAGRGPFRYADFTPAFRVGH